MQLADAIALIKHAFVPEQATAVWADLGCGSGLFTHALAQLLPTGSIIYAVDKSNVTLHPFVAVPSITIRQQQFDFTTETGELRDLDGIIMANSLHYVRDKISVLQQWKRCMKTGAPFIIVEYDTDKPNLWVPYPVRFASLEQLCKAARYRDLKKIGVRASRYQTGGMYAAVIL